ENDVASIIDESDKPTVTASAESSNINESGSPDYIFNIEFDKPIKTTTTFSAVQVGGTASSNDYVLSTAVMPAYSTKTTMAVSIVNDIDVEDTESLILEILPNNISDLGEVRGSPTISFNIENFTSEEMTMLLEWDAADNPDLCNIDFDVFLDSYGAYAFTGSCPEFLMECVNPSNLCTSVLPDGIHLIIVDLWDLHGAPSSIQIPLRLTIGKAGIILANLDLGNFYTTDNGDSISGNDGTKVVGYVEVTDGKYSIFDSNDNLIEQE
ncbi:MAG TPA: hypothetical protein VKN14_00150, partial [Flavobacteriaceae bacterium]|nr:hypothetical protein [Flavobacteriaceae bacterium]